MAKTRIVTPPPSGSKPVTTQKPTNNKMWAFSFRFFKQIKYFGFDGDATSFKISWFSSVFERLSDLSKMAIDDVLGDKSNQQANRYHKIDWAGKNVPLSRTDFNWIDDDYLNNPDEFPIVQFDISKALGRVVGFWDENLVFQVLLLDRLHNIQPSKRNGYIVRPCDRLDSEYVMMCKEVELARGKCADDTCEAKKHLNTIVQSPNNSGYGPVVIMDLASEDQLGYADNLIQNNVATSYSAIFEHGINFLLDSKTVPKP